MSSMYKFLVAIVVASFICLAGGSTIGRMPGEILSECNLLNQKVPECSNFCGRSGLGEYSCCDEDNSLASRPGSCPNANLQVIEKGLLCLADDLILCENDSDCLQEEQKCCYSQDTQHRICRDPVKT